MTKEKLIKRVIDTVIEDVREKITTLITIAFSEWEKEDIEKIIEEEK